MRPKKLTMQAFGSFLKKTVVDFDKLDSKGLFLITGETGSGKTSIFDGIVFALYGDASGESRDGKMMRSDYAEKGDMTYAELIFEIGGKEYTVSHGIDSKNKTNAYLIYPSGKQVSKTEEVKKAVESIIGLNQKQFSQVVMISQGEFRKLLNTKTDERQKLFRSLFGTGIYEKLQDKIKNEVVEKRKELDTIEMRITDLIKNIRCDDSSKCFDRIEEIKSAPLSHKKKDAVLGPIGELIGEDNAALKTLDEDLNKVEAELSDANTKVTKGIERARTEKMLEESKKKFNETADEQIRLKPAVEEADRKDSELIKLREKMTVLENQREDYKKYNELSAERKRLVGEINAANEHLAALGKERDDKSRVIGEKTEEAKKLVNADVELVKASNAKNDIVSAKAVLDDISRLIGEHKELSDKLKKDQTDYENKRNISETAKMAYKHADDLYYDNMAGLIAKKLKENESCPVCGSKIHDRPARMSEEYIRENLSEERLKELREISEKAEAGKNAASMKAGSTKALYEQKTKELSERSKAVLGTADINETEEKLPGRRSELDEKMKLAESAINAAKANAARKELLGREIPEAERKLTELKERCDSTEKELIKAQTDLKNNESRSEELKNKLVFGSADELENEITRLRTLAEQYKAEIDGARNAYNECENKLHTLKGQIEAAEKSLEGSGPVDIEKEQSRINELSTQKSELVSRRDDIMIRLKNNEKNRDETESRWTDYYNMAEEVGWKKKVAHIIGGAGNDGSDKLTLESYIQAEYFERIIERANRRLVQMTDNRCMLVRRDKVADRRSQVGLDLDVKNLLNGAQRQVGTLSGGEAFMASLALALGFSDEIQSNASGIQIDSMFIDEGFGTLEGDALTQSVKTLMNLAGSNRFVGVISHVTELKNSIDKQIIVRKDPKGESSIEIKND